MMHDLIARHEVIEPAVPCRMLQEGAADSVCEDGVVVKSRLMPLHMMEPEDCQLQIVGGIIQNPFVLRLSEGAI